MDYSRFDHIGSDSDSGDDGAAAAPRPSAAKTASRPPAPSITQAASRATEGGSNNSSGGSGKGVKGSESFSQPMMMTASKKGKEGRIKFEHEGVVLIVFSVDYVCRYTFIQSSLED